MKHYTQNEEASGSVYHDVSEGSYPNEKQKSRRDYFASFLTEIDNGSLLEVGCSKSDFLLSLELEGWDLTGLEPSIKAANQAKAKELNVICGSLEACNLIPESYDVVSSFSVLEHLYDVYSSIQMMTRFLKKDGLLFIDVPDTMKPVPQLAEFFTFEHMSHFTKNSLMYFLKSCGYDEFEFDETVKDSRLRVCTMKISDAVPTIESSAISDNYKKLKKDSKVLIERINKYKKNKKK